MTVVVGYLPENGGRAVLQLGALFANSLGVEMIVATATPVPWTSPAIADVGREVAKWTDEFCDYVQRSAADYLEADRFPGLVWRFQRLAHRTPSTALAHYAAEHRADVLVIGSSNDGQVGRIVTSSTAGALLHSATVPVAIAPRGYRSPADGLLSRITCAYSGKGEADILGPARRLTDRVDAPLRVCSVVVRGSAMYPPLVGLRVEDQVFEHWKAQSQTVLESLVAGHRLPATATVEVAAGPDWSAALGAVDWLDGEILMLGSSRDTHGHVFIGSRAARIIRGSPVPVVVLPR